LVNPRGANWRVDGGGATVKASDDATNVSASSIAAL
jgi:hypothetical protein